MIKVYSLLTFLRHLKKMSKGITEYSILNPEGEDMTIATSIQRGCYMSNYLRDHREARS